MESSNSISIKNNNIKYILTNINVFNYYNNLKNLELIDKKNFLIIKTHNISDNLRHSDDILDRILHQTKICVIDKTNHKPLLYIDKSIKHHKSEYTYNKNSYLKSYVYDKIQNFNNSEFDNRYISIYKNYIGSYIVLFNHNNIWKFLFSDNIYTLTIHNHYILYTQLHTHLDELDKNICYHLILVDSRIRNLISYKYDNNYIVLIKSTHKYTLRENFNNPYAFFTTNKNIYLSCMDELNLYIETLDKNNTHLKKITHKGVIMKINIDVNDSIYIRFDTDTYKNLLHMIPKGLNLNEIYLQLYQNNKLTDILQYINDTSTDIIKRINTSMGTLSREILDIYHMTRNQNNSTLYNLLPPSYRKILYYIHRTYIEQKNSIDMLIVKISITVENVYNILKEIDIKLLVNIYKERNLLNENILNSEHELKKLLKACVHTQIQSKLL
jgi:hypothetical protein